MTDPTQPGEAAAHGPAAPPSWAAAPPVPPAAAAGPTLTGHQPLGQPYSNYVPAPEQRPASGMAIASLILGIVGVLFGLVPLTFWIAGPLGVVGLVLGLVALTRARRARTARKLPLAGTIVSAVAVVLSVVGAVIFFAAVDQLGDDLDGINQAGKAAASATEDTTSGTALDPNYSPPSSAPPAPESTEAPADDETYALGEKAQWEDGVTAVVRSVKRATFGETSTTPGPGVKVTVTITNGSKEAIEIFPTADIRLGADGTNSEQVYADGCDGLGDLGRVAPGRSVTGTMCFAGKGSTVDVSFAPTFEHNALTWTGRVA